MTVEIVTNSKMNIVDMGDYVYIYLPMAYERKLYAPGIVNPCWRLRINK